MNFGCMGKIEDAELIKSAGFDSIELSLSEIFALDETEFRFTRDHLKNIGLKYDVFSWMLPITLDITSSSFQMTDWGYYLEKCAERSAELGASIWPFGVGKGRSIKKGNGTYNEQRQRVIDLLVYIDRIVSQYNIRIAIEPLGPANSNFISTLREASAIKEATHSSTIKLMCDLRHMVKNNDIFSEISSFSSEIIHCHIDFPLGQKRLFPEEGDGFDYLPYLREVSILPCQRITFEAIDSYNTSTNLCSSLQYLKSLMNTL